MRSYSQPDSDLFSLATVGKDCVGLINKYYGETRVVSPQNRKMFARRPGCSAKEQVVTMLCKLKPRATISWVGELREDKQIINNITKITKPALKNLGFQIFAMNSLKCEWNRLHADILINKWPRLIKKEEIKKVIYTKDATRVAQVPVWLRWTIDTEAIAEEYIKNKNNLLWIPKLSSGNIIVVDDSCAAGTTQGIIYKILSKLGMDLSKFHWLVLLDELFQYT